MSNGVYAHLLHDLNTEQGTRYTRPSKWLLLGLQAETPPPDQPSNDHHSPFTSFGDIVTRFDEASAAQGCLGRFTGSQVMPLVKQFLAVQMKCVQCGV